MMRGDIELRFPAAADGYVCINDSSLFFIPGASFQKHLRDF